jgi:hypothetical protein
MVAKKSKAIKVLVGLSNMVARKAKIGKLFENLTLIVKTDFYTLCFEIVSAYVCATHFTAFSPKYWHNWLHLWKAMFCEGLFFVSLCRNFTCFVIF